MNKFWFFKNTSTPDDIIWKVQQSPLPSSKGDAFQDLQQMSKNMGSSKPYMYYIFLYKPT